MPFRESLLVNFNITSRFLLGRPAFPDYLSVSCGYGITYNGKSSSFEKLLEKDNSFTIHHRNIKILATETYKFLQGLSPLLMNGIFVERSNGYSLRGNNNLTRQKVNSQ